MAMNQAEIERMLRRHDNDISDLYPLLGQMQSTLRRHTERFDEIDARFDGVESRLDGLDTKVGELDAKVDGLTGQVTEVLTLLRDAR